MSTNFQDGHVNGPRLHLAQSASRFPLSSPISDDRTSDQSFESSGTTTSPGVANILKHSQNPFRTTIRGNTNGQGEVHSKQYGEPWSRAERDTAKLSHRTPGRGLQYRDVSQERKHKPGLNIVTNFSIPPKCTAVIDIVPSNEVARAADLEQQLNNAVSASPTKTKFAASKVPLPKSDSNVLRDAERLRKTNDGKKQSNSMDRARKRAFNGSKAGQGEQSQVEEQERSWNAEHEPKQQEHKAGRDASYLPKSSHPTISNPFRAQKRQPKRRSQAAQQVVIGIAIPQNEVEAHELSGERNKAVTLIPSAPPGAGVTTADATISRPRAASRSPSAKSPASSVYSEAIAASPKRDADALPIPSLPLLHKKNLPVTQPFARRSVDSWEIDSPRSLRPHSSETIIGEDGVNQTQDRRQSTDSDEAILPSSCDTRRHRSKGWWNLLLSPMLSRAETDTSRNSGALQEKPPALPNQSSKMQAEPGADDNGIMSAISPETPRRAGLGNVRSSSWSDWTRWGHDRQRAAVPSPSPHAAGEVQASLRHDEKPSRARNVAMEGSGVKEGLAAEYYKACQFNLVNPVPYFNCVNHDCARALPKLVDFSKTSTSLKNIEKGPKSTVMTPQGNNRLEKKFTNTEIRSRSASDSTLIEDNPIVLSPNVRKAEAKPIIKASRVRELEAPTDEGAKGKERPRTAQVRPEKTRSTDSRAAIPPPYSPPPEKRKPPRYVGIMPPGRHVVPFDPGPISPEAQKVLNRNGGIPLSQVQQAGPISHTVNLAYPASLPLRPATAHMSLSDLERPIEVRHKAEARRRCLEREDAAAQRAGGLWRGRGCFPKNGCFGRAGRAGRIRKRWYVAITTSLVIIITLVVILATQLTREADQTPVQSQWLNLTGYPPMPTGISTITRPDVASAVTACVEPSSLWSCAVPREDQGSGSPNAADQPNFRLEIRFRNGTVDADKTVPLPKANRRRSIGRWESTLMSRQADSFADSLFEPNPAPPSLTEQEFLGDTTDNVTAPFSGEVTPFFITLLASDPLLPDSYNDNTEISKRRLKRQLESGRGSIPAPAVLDDGTAAPANLLPQSPQPFSQPVRLYDRGLDSEHYGFYTYFDRSIFLQRSAQLNGSDSSPTRSGDGNDPGNEDGGSPKDDADLRCTWAETRFLMQIWTNPNFAARLLDPPSGGKGESSSGPQNAVDSADEDEDDKDKDDDPSSASDFTRPGSFPYPITIRLDRHGGDSSKKGVYCYAMDGQQQQGEEEKNKKILVDQKTLVAEVRGAGGPGLVNPAPAVFADPESGGGGGDGGGGGNFDPDIGGIDGGVGGCRCEWRNWVDPV